MRAESGEAEAGRRRKGKRRRHRRIAFQAQRGREADPVVGRQYPATGPEPWEQARIVVDHAPDPQCVALLE
jgi:hypothetical protein